MDVLRWRGVLVPKRFALTLTGTRSRGETQKRTRHEKQPFEKITTILYLEANTYGSSRIAFDAGVLRNKTE
eukprot:scaffold14789_cov150-Amphora_coffeaeformis.AAC.3